MEAKLCQSCGMPLDNEELLGTETDKSKNQEYCIYCYRDGIFTSDITMDEMIDECLQFLDEFNENSNEKLTREEAVSQMRTFFPTLKRWKK